MENNIQNQNQNKELPRQLNGLSQEQKRILGEFYDWQKNKQWFKRAELIPLHPSHMKPTIEIYCSYNPVLEMKEIIQFASSHNIAIEIINSSNQG